jgi:hypothetical protein
MTRASKGRDFQILNSRPFHFSSRQNPEAACPELVEGEILTRPKPHPIPLLSKERGIYLTLALKEEEDFIVPFSFSLPPPLAH